MPPADLPLIPILRDWLCGTVRIAGCQFIFISVRKAWSLAVAVVGAGILRIEREEHDPLAALPPSSADDTLSVEGLP
jgi:hypothetical protein